MMFYCLWIRRHTQSTANPFATIAPAEDDSNEEISGRPTEEEMETLLNHLNDPSGRLLTDFEDTAFARSPALLSSWVPQPLPSCAAAVIGRYLPILVLIVQFTDDLRSFSTVAGVLNTLTPFKSWCSSDILPYYVAMTERRIATQKKRCLAMLRYEPWTEETLEKLTNALRVKLRAVHGLDFGGTSREAKPNTLTKTLLLCAARECMADGSVGVPLSVARAIFPEEFDQSNHQDRDDATDEAARVASPMPQLAEAVSARGTGGVSFDISLDDPKTMKEVPRWKQCQEELYQYWHLMDGYEKLVHPTRPSTAVCGNAALLYAVEAITIQEPERMFGSNGGAIKRDLFRGRTPGNLVCRIGNADDSDDTRDTAWKQLWTAFSREKTVFVYHMKNHYALIFALRVWRSFDDGDGHQVRREVLTARRGQRPSCWISWREAYDTMAA